MPAWYDILDIKIERTVDQKQLIASADLINQIIQQQLNKGIKPERIVLAGFSQGGAVAIHAALSCAHRHGFSGIIQLFGNSRSI